MKRKDVEEALMELGLKRGVLFFRELDEVFPADYFPLLEIEHLLMRLEDLGVSVVEKEGRRKSKPRHGRKAA